MKRDMDLIRLLLIEVEGEAKPDLSGYTELQLLYHRALLHESGLAVGWVAKAHDGYLELGGISGCELYRLTWAGHEFLDAVRDDTIWNKAKAVLKSSAASATADVVKDTCKMILTVAVQAAMARATQG